MPYLILAIGVLTGLYTLYRFFMQADVRQVKALFMTFVFVFLALAILLMAVTGRLPAALALLVFLAPFAWKYFNGTAPQNEKPTSPAIPRKEALEILGLTEPVTPDSVNESYKRLMQKVHPDNQGSDWMAVKLNQARDALLKGPPA